MFCSPSWEGNGHVFSKHAAKYCGSMEEAIKAEIDWLKRESEESE